MGMQGARNALDINMNAAEYPPEEEAITLKRPKIGLSFLIHAESGHSCFASFLALVYFPLKHHCFSSFSLHLPFFFVFLFSSSSLSIDSIGITPYIHTLLSIHTQCFLSRSSSRWLRSPPLATTPCPRTLTSTRSNWALAVCLPCFDTSLSIYLTY